MENIHLLNSHTHVYFSHSYKNQADAEYILNNFKKSNSKLYDLEYFLDNSKRFLAFGYYAGIVGCGLGLLQFLYKANNQNISNLKYYKSINDLYNQINQINQINNNLSKSNIKICLIGPNGNCGQGVQFFASLFNLNLTCLSRKDSKNNLNNFDIIFNCICIKEYIEPWFDSLIVFNKKIIIVDVSCDYNNKYNPIKIYNQKTTWTKPVYSYNEYVDIIAIDNLPSLLPFESSSYFSSKLIELFSTYKKDELNYWSNNLNIYLDKIKF